MLLTRNCAAQAGEVGLVDKYKSLCLLQPARGSSSMPLSAHCSRDDRIGACTLLFSLLLGFVLKLLLSHGAAQ